MATRITSLTKGGKALSVPSPIIKGDGTANIVVQQGAMGRKRLNLRGGIEGSNVKVTNPKYATRMKRTASLGMGAVGQRGRVQDVSGTL